MDKSILQSKVEVMFPILDERARRLRAATEAIAAGWGRITLVSEVTGLSPTTVRAGIAEISTKSRSNRKKELQPGRLRVTGGGRKRLVEKDPTLAQDLEFLVDPATRGNPMSPLRWTSKSTGHLAQTLRELGHQVSWKTVARMLIAMGYSLQANRKSKEGEVHPDRNHQFAHINQQTKAFQSDGQPVISVDTTIREANRAAREAWRGERSEPEGYAQAGKARARKKELALKQWSASLVPSQLAKA